MKIEISICTYNSGAFEVMFRDKQTGKELSFEDARRLGDEEFDFANSIAPACVWTTYTKDDGQ